MVSVFIQPGWAENKWQEKRFIGAFPPTLAAATSPEKADVIVAHSAACFDVQPVSRTKLIVLIGAPYWPNKSIFVRMFRHIVVQAPAQIRDWGFSFWFQKIAWNTFYVMAHPLSGHKNRGRLKREIFSQLAGRNVLIIRNHEDMYCSPQIAELARRYGFKFAALGGSHEDCWFNPRPYIDLIRKEL